MLVVLVQVIFVVLVQAVQNVPSQLTCSVPMNQAYLREESGKMKADLGKESVCCVLMYITP